MPISEPLRAILNQCRAPERFRDWLSAEELFDPTDVALLAADESETQVKIIDACTGIDRRKDVVAVKKVWMLCKATTTREMAVR